MGEGLTPEGVKQALSSWQAQFHPALPGRTNHRRAGVLVPLQWTSNGVDALLTLRPQRLNRHGGEVSFPGGRPEEGDESLQQTALREAHEELGLKECEILGALSSTPVYTSEFRLDPFMAVVPSALTLLPDPVEVEEVLRLNIGQALAAESAEAIGIDFQGRHFLMPIYRIDGHVVYGATSIVMREALEVCAAACGLQPPPLVAGNLTIQQVLMQRAAAGKAQPPK